MNKNNPFRTIQTDKTTQKVLSSNNVSSSNNIKLNIAGINKTSFTTLKSSRTTKNSNIMFKNDKPSGFKSLSKGKTPTTTKNSRNNNQNSELQNMNYPTTKIVTIDLEGIDESLRPTRKISPMHKKLYESSMFQVRNINFLE